MGADAVPSASSLENMAGILIALLILLIAAFHDTQKVQCYVRLLAMMTVSPEH